VNVEETITLQQLVQADQELEEMDRVQAHLGLEQVVKEMMAEAEVEITVEAVVAVKVLLALIHQTLTLEVLGVLVLKTIIKLDQINITLAEAEAELGEVALLQQEEMAEAETALTALTVQHQLQARQILAEVAEEMADKEMPLTDPLKQQAVAE
jgi:hypothetical protein